jgi:hypothetical protein
LVVVPGQDQVDAGSLEISVEQQVRVRNEDRIYGRMRGDRIDVKVGIGMRTCAINGQFGIEFARVIQKTTAKG